MHALESRRNGVDSFALLRLMLWQFRHELRASPGVNRSRIT